MENGIFLKPLWEVKGYDPVLREQTEIVQTWWGPRLAGIRMIKDCGSHLRNQISLALLSTAYYWH